MHCRSCLVTVRTKVLQNVRLVGFSKRTNWWCAFSCSICNKTTTLLGVSRTAVSKIVTAHTNQGKTSLAERNSGRKPKLGERDGRTLKGTVSKNYRTTTVKVTAEFNIRVEDPGYTKPVWQELHKSSIHSTAAISKPLIAENNAKRRKRWCDGHKIWTSDDLKYAILPDESSYKLFPTRGRVDTWRTPKETYNPECLVPTVKYRGGSVMIWTEISWFCAGHIITLVNLLPVTTWIF